MTLSRADRLIQLRCGIARGPRDGVRAPVDPIAPSTVSQAPGRATRGFGGNELRTGQAPPCANTAGGACLLCEQRRPCCARLR